MAAARMNRRQPRDYRVSNSNLAYDYSALERAQEVRHPKIRTIARPKVSLRPAERVSAAGVAGFVAVAVLLVLVLLSHVQLTQLSASVVALEKEVSALEAENITLTTSYNRVFDLETVESTARAAGMSKPSPSQIYYIDMGTEDSASVYAAQEYNVLDRVFSSFGQGFYSVVEYFA